ncbi:hypothetical protein BJX70DRAFT_383695 [Aspergillus crustosus]
MRAGLAVTTLAMLYVKSEDNESGIRSIDGRSDGSDGSRKLHVNQGTLNISLQWSQKPLSYIWKRLGLIPDLGMYSCLKVSGN